MVNVLPLVIYRPQLEVLSMHSIGAVVKRIRGSKILLLGLYSLGWFFLPFFLEWLRMEGYKSDTM